MTAYENMDSNPFGLESNFKIVERRFFMEAGVAVEELVLTDKLIWCLQPMEKMVVNGRRNPLVHADLPKGGLEEARFLVRAKFLECHSDLFKGEKP